MKKWLRHEIYFFILAWFFWLFIYIIMNELSILNIKIDNLDVKMDILNSKWEEWLTITSE